ncbi:PREDICTED: spindle assembly abnormal protein 6 homolog [Amphimedon queenslandica]|uniref:Spindle assembly abnormal protein 6 N-terminal domain-containing protein n=1 Tax=Amphimedon queenslandica TaxID=400682 RepID=A0A1X7UQ11_AMPQE|nr:PREDICTED: spindle assembly abnormal protein 6 homolog [Amphimedon queenslandica]|eukprot:XP_011404281.1 PREDICTED: spindle assembly abnormal protein 6 homolog [Amphimedon queenslandica]
MEVLFEKPLPVTVKKGDREECQSNVGITILFNTITSPISKKELIVRLTDEKDPFFLYTLTINEDDFQQLKAQQGLLVDFATFPQKFIDLLQLCLGEADQESPKFILQLISSSPQALACFNIIETNQFRHLNHLTLQLVPASDVHLKKYLAECLLSLKDQVLDLTIQLKVTKSDLTSQLAHSEEVLKHRTQELEKLKSDWSARTSSLVNEHTAALTSTKEKAIENMVQAQEKHEREKKELETSYNTKIASLEESLKELDTANKELTDRKYRSEAAIRELKAKLKGTEEELSGMREELSLLRKSNSSLDTNTHELNKNINQLQTRVAVLEQELKDKEQVVHKTNDLLAVANEQKKGLDDQLEQAQRHIVKLDNTYKQTAKEVTKGNEIIQKLQAELKSLKLKMKSRNIVTNQQEKLIHEKEAELEKVRLGNERFSEQLKMKESERATLETELKQFKEQVEELKETIKNNENVINWLNKQINERAITGVGGAGPRPQDGVSSIHPVHSYSAGFYQSPQFSSTPASGSVTGGGEHKINQKVLFKGPPLKRGPVPSPLSAHSLTASPLTTPTFQLTTPTSRSQDPQLDRYLPPMGGVSHQPRLLTTPTITNS